LEDPLESLSRRINALKTPEVEQAKAGDDSGQMAIAMRLSAELLAGVLVGAAIGYFLDKWLDTSPWLLIVLICMGFAAGIVNMTRAMDRLDKPSI
jgi:ATP synthase protein I